MRRTVTALVVLTATAGVGLAAADEGGATRSAVVERVVATFDPANFDNPKRNPYFPTNPGHTTVLRGSEDGERFVDRVHVTYRTKLILGVPARVFNDVVRTADGKVVERTKDWYAADNDGNVWYLGENTATYDENGHLESREGSWRAGVDGAVPGLIMPANPHATLAYRQEFLRGEAEDQAWIVGRGATVRTPARTFHHVVRSFEWTRLEKNVLSLKLYARGVGIVHEHEMSGGNENFVLVRVHD